MTTTRQTLDTILRTSFNSSDTDRAPFSDLLADLHEFFDFDIPSALAEDQTAALAESDRIIGEHLRLARARLAEKAPIVAWDDHISLTQAVPEMLRRAADLRFVAILAPEPKPESQLVLEKVPDMTWGKVPDMTYGKLSDLL